VHDVVQAIILGVLIGGVYALMASGLTLVFGIMKVINVAQGALVILAAYLSYALFAHLHVDPFLSILIVTPAMFVLGVAVQLVFVRSLRGPDASELSLLVTWALALGIEGVLSVVFQTTYRSTLPSYAYRSWDIFGYHVGLVRVLGFGASALLLGLLSLLLTRTRFGRAVRATVQNPTAATLLGVDSNRIQTVSFGIGVSMAAAAGAVYGVIYPFNPGSHYDLISRLLSIVVLGGLGSIGGGGGAAPAMGAQRSTSSASTSSSATSASLLLDWSA